MVGFHWFLVRNVPFVYMSRNLKSDHLFSLKYTFFFQKPCIFYFEIKKKTIFFSISIIIIFENFKIKFGFENRNFEKKSENRRNICFCSNFFVFQSYVLRFRGIFCQVLIRSFPESFVKTIYPGGTPL